MREFIYYARDLIKEAEGFNGVEYICPAGYRTIGYGRNLETNPLSEIELLKYFNPKNGKLSVSETTASEWLTSEIVKIVKECEGKDWFEFIGTERKGVVIDLIYNLGLSKWNTFKKTQDALKEKNFGIASYELSVGTGEGGKSKYLLATGNRALRNIEIMKFGEKIHDFYKGEGK